MYSDDNNNNNNNNNNNKYNNDDNNHYQTKRLIPMSLCYSVNGSSVYVWLLLKALF